MTTKKKAIKVTVSKKALAPVIKKITEELKGKLASKPATILYKKLPDDMILIVGFENFLNADEIEKKFGEVVSDTYMAYQENMVKVFDSFGVQRIHFGYNDTFSIGMVMPKKSFSILVQRAKKCGGLLHDIIAAVNSGEVKRITI